MPHEKSEFALFTKHPLGGSFFADYGDSSPSCRRGSLSLFPEHRVSSVTQSACSSHHLAAQV